MNKGSKVKIDVTDTAGSAVARVEGTADICVTITPYPRDAAAKQIVTLYSRDDIDGLIWALRVARGWLPEEE
jgi:hypothetical protein